MKSGIFEIDGVEYPDADASDPVALGWMQGSPPSAAKQIRFQDDRFLEFPQIRWSLSHMRELAPTAAIWRANDVPSDLGVVPLDLAPSIDALAFADLRGRQLTWAQSLKETYTDGIVVLHRGRRIYERYLGDLQAHRPHACFSITKSYAATLAATLIHERALDEAKTVSHYLPEMAGTAYEDAPLRQVLDMQIGVEYSELYADPKAHIWDYGRAGGLRPRGPDYSGPGNFYEYLRTLRRQGDHGAAFAYKTVNTEVMCWVMKRVTGVSLEGLLSQRIWSQLGGEGGGYLRGVPFGVALG